MSSGKVERGSVSTIGSVDGTPSSGTTISRAINWPNINYDDIRNISVVTPTGSGTAVCAFDNSMTCGGTYAYNHTSSFQDRLRYTSTGQDGVHYGFYSQPTFSGGGGCGTRYGVIIKDPLGASAISQNYGILVESLVRGSTANYAIATGGTTPVWFGGNLGIALQSGLVPPGWVLTLGGGTAKTIGVERHQTTNTAGNNLTVNAGGATSGATDKDGGMVVIAPGLTTGAGKASVRIQRTSRDASATSDNAVCDAFIVSSEKTLVHDTDTQLFFVSLADLNAAGGHITYTVLVTNGTDAQCHSGACTYAAVRKGNTITASIVDETATDAADAETDVSLSLTESWTILTDYANNKFTIRAKFTSNLTGTPVYKMYYTIHNGSRSSVTQI